MVDPAACAALCDGVDVVGVVHADADSRPPGQFGQPAQLERTDIWLAMKRSVQTGVRQHLGFVQLGAEKIADAVCREVTGQAGTFERFEMDADVDRPFPERLEHAPHVGVDDVEVQEQLRCIEGVQGLAGSRKQAVVHTCAILWQWESGVRSQGSGVRSYVLTLTPDP